jgi:hypothetical protein
VSGSAKSTASQTKSAATTKTAAAPATRKSRAKAAGAGAAKVKAKSLEMGGKAESVSLGMLYPGMPEPVRATSFLKREGESFC